MMKQMSIEKWIEEWRVYATSEVPYSETDRDFIEFSLNQLYQSAGFEKAPKLARFASNTFSACMATGILSRTIQAIETKKLKESDKDEDDVRSESLLIAMDIPTNKAYQQTFDECFQKPSDYAFHHSELPKDVKAALQEACFKSFDDVRVVARKAVFGCPDMLEKGQLPTEVFDEAYDMVDDIATQLDIQDDVERVKETFKKNKENAIDMCQQMKNRIQGGNMQPRHDSFISYVRTVSDDLTPFKCYDPWLNLAINSGPRYVHTDFAIISERPYHWIKEMDFH